MQKICKSKTGLILVYTEIFLGPISCKEKLDIWSNVFKWLPRTHSESNGPYGNRFLCTLFMLMWYPEHTLWSKVYFIFFKCHFKGVFLCSCYIVKHTTYPLKDPFLQYESGGHFASFLLLTGPIHQCTSKMMTSLSKAPQCTVGKGDQLGSAKLENSKIWCEKCAWSKRITLIIWPTVWFSELDTLLMRYEVNLTPYCIKSVSNSLDQTVVYAKHAGNLNQLGKYNSSDTKLKPFSLLRSTEWSLLLPY